MNKISPKRMGVDGVERELTAIRDYLVGEVENEIRDNLDGKIPELDATDQPLATYIRDELHNLLTADVDGLKNWVDYFDNNYPGRFKVIVNGHWKKTDLGEALLEAFDFKTYRSGVLVEVAKRLNVKTCPYCNMQYTLFASEKKVRTVKKLARFQFDHFYDKSAYPMLSMSFFNLIPSCGVCNQGKSTNQLSLAYHPYYSDICNQFHFELKDPIDPYAAARINDEIEVLLVPEAGVDKDGLDTFQKTFHLKALYERHGDVAQEVFDKAYEKPYYDDPDSFKFLGKRAPDYIKRLWLGNYATPDEINKRPMAKFTQDLWAQAVGEKGKKKTVK